MVHHFPIMSDNLGLFPSTFKINFLKNLNEILQIVPNLCNFSKGTFCVKSLILLPKDTGIGSSLLGNVLSAMFLLDFVLRTSWQPLLAGSAGACPSSFSIPDNSGK